MLYSFSRETLNGYCVGVSTIHNRIDNKQISVVIFSFFFLSFFPRDSLIALSGAYTACGDSITNSKKRGSGHERKSIMYIIKHEKY